MDKQHSIIIAAIRAADRLLMDQEEVDRGKLGMPDAERQAVYEAFRKGKVVANAVGEKDLRSLEDQLAEATARAERAEEWNRQMVAKAAEVNNLEGYRELGTKLAEASVREMQLVAHNTLLQGALYNIFGIIDDSTGVAGYHLNSDVARWEEFGLDELRPESIAELIAKGD
jgi:hypothetical protein